jgi:nitrite reductase/ring-hydroxylating ferredoxin subunit
MSAKQSNALDKNPNGLNLVQVNQLERRIKANIHRVWENVLDWEHLPSLHETSFDYVALDQGGDWGWRTWSNPEQTASVELTVNRDASEYVARSYNGEQQISEIWTKLTPVGEETDICVTFELPDIADDQVEKLGGLMLGLYTQLWDEDEAMMVERERQLQRKYADSAPSELQLHKPLNLPVTVALGRGEWTLRDVKGELVMHSAICPHLLGPLDHNAKIEGNIVTCPWHGYDFDIQTGECLTPSANCAALKSPPQIEQTDSHIILKLN